MKKNRNKKISSSSLEVFTRWILTSDLDNKKKGDHCNIKLTTVLPFVALHVFVVDCYAGSVLTSKSSAKAGAIPEDLLPFLSAKV